MAHICIYIYIYIYIYIFPIGPVWDHVGKETTGRWRQTCRKEVGTETTAHPTHCWSSHFLYLSDL